MQKQNIYSAKTISFYILISIYLFNDFVFIFFADTVIKYLIFDYLFRIISILIILFLIKSKNINVSYIKLNTVSLKSFIIWSLILIVAGIIILHLFENILLKIIPDIHFFTYPKYNDSLLKIIDLTFGLLLVALSEEIVFRGYCYSYLFERTDNIISILIISSIIFGLIHWSGGIVSIITTGLWGFFTIISVYKTGSIFSSICAHYVINFIAFSEIIPPILSP